MLEHLKQDSIFYNNVGCVYLRAKKYYASVNFFSKSLEEFQNNGATSDQNDFRTRKYRLWPQLMHSYEVEVYYNCGLSFLASKRPLDAFACFHRTVDRLRNWPQLWLRMAECCIQFDVSKNYQKSDSVRESDKILKLGKSSRVLIRFCKVYFFYLPTILTYHFN